MNNRYSGQGIYQSQNKRLSYDSVPPVQELRHFLAELYQSNFGGNVDFCFNMHGEPYTLNLHYIKSEGRTKWRLYGSGASNTMLVWEKDTRDVSHIHTLLLRANGEAGNSTIDTQSNAILSPVEVELSSNELLANLKQFLAEAQHGETTSQEQVIIEQIKDPSCELIDLNIGRAALRELFLNDLGVLSFPAFLFCLIREYANANEHRAPLAVELLQMNLYSNGAICPLPHPILVDVLSKLKKLQRKTDLIGQYDKANVFVAILPDTDIESVKFLVERQKNLLNRLEGEYGFSPGSIQFKAAVGGATPFCNSMATILGATDQAMAAAQKDQMPVAIFNELFPAQTPVAKNIDYGVVQELVEKLIAKEYGIFSFPVLVAFLEHEINRAKRSRQPLHLLLINLNCQAQDWPRLPEAICALIARINGLKSGGNHLLAHYNFNSVALFAPKIFATTLKKLGVDLVNSIAQQALVKDAKLPYSVSFNVLVVEADPKNPDFLQLKPYKAE